MVNLTKEFWCLDSKLTNLVGYQVAPNNFPIVNRTSAARRITRTIIMYIERRPVRLYMER
jgi:hypothetical protein